MRDEDEDINKLFKNKMISKAIYNKNDIRIEADVNGINSINDFFIDRNESFKIFLKNNNVDLNSLSLYELDNLYQNMIQHLIQNVSSEDIVNWYQHNNKDFTLNDFNNPTNSNLVNKIKSDYTSALIKSLEETGKNKLIDFWMFYINGFEYHHQHDSKEALNDLKKHIENEGIIFSKEENNEWNKKLKIYYE